MKNIDNRKHFRKNLTPVVTAIVFAILMFAGFSYYVMVYQGGEKVSMLAGAHSSDNSTSPNSNVYKENLTPSLAPTDFPFEEITIPYLRERDYESQLGELQKLSDKLNFSAYRTSYYSDGYKINGYLTIPHGQIPEGGWPGVVFVHGYIPPREYQTNKNYVSYADALANKGLVVFKIDLRGHGESEGETTGAYYSEDYVVDTLNAYRALQNSDFVNPDKIGLWGHSMAGNIVFRSKIALPEIPKVVVWAGAVYTYEDFLEYGINDESYQPPSDDTGIRRKRDELFGTYGNFDAESEFWKQVVPTNYLSGIIGDFQIHHAVDDDVVSVEYSRNLANILEENNIKVELYEYLSGGHNITGDNFERAMERSAEFLTSY